MTQQIINIVLDGQLISCLIERNSRGCVYSWRLIVDPLGQLRVKVAKDTSEVMIKKFLFTQETWIKKQLKKRQDFLSDTKVMSLSIGSYVCYLGQYYPLCLTDDKPKSALIWQADKGFLVTKALAKNEEILANCLDRWYHKQAMHHFLSRVQYLAQQSCWIKDLPILRIRKMKSQWGNCRHHLKTITLNLHLIKLPEDLIDYVIVHKLCHLKEANHSAHFYQLIQSLMPDWRIKQNMIKNHVYHLYGLVKSDNN